MIPRGWSSNIGNNVARMALLLVSDRARVSSVAAADVAAVFVVPGVAFCSQQACGALFEAVSLCPVARSVVLYGKASS